jgi:hypothetical protein
LATTRLPSRSIAIPNGRSSSSRGRGSLSDQGLDARARVDPDHRAVVVGRPVVDDVDLAARRHRDAGGIEELAAARHEALPAGERIDANDRTVLPVGFAEVGDDQVSVGLDREVVRAPEEIPLGAVAGDLDEGTRARLRAEDHGAGGEAVRRVDDVRVARRGHSRPGHQRDREKWQEEDARPAHHHRR